MVFRTKHSNLVSETNKLVGMCLRWFKKNVKGNDALERGRTFKKTLDKPQAVHVQPIINIPW